MWPCGASQADTGTTTDYTDYTTLLQIDDTVPTSQTELVGVKLIQTLGHQKEQHTGRNTYKLLYQSLQTFY